MKQFLFAAALAAATPVAAEESEFVQLQIGVPEMIQRTILCDTEEQLRSILAAGLEGRFEAAQEVYQELYANHGPNGPACLYLRINMTVYPRENMGSTESILLNDPEAEPQIYYIIRVDWKNMFSPNLFKGFIIASEPALAPGEAL